MTEKELQDRLTGMENKLNKLQNIEERLERCFKNVEKFRDKMIQSGYSYAMLEEFNKAIQPITQHCNEIRNARKKLAMLEEEHKRMKKEEEAKTAKRKSVFVNAFLMNQEPEFPYHHKCRNFSFIDGEPLCEIKMDLQYCGKNCPYATTEPCSNKVDRLGRTVAYEKRRK